MEPVSLFQVQLPRMYQVRVMCALSSRQYGVSSGDHLRMTHHPRVSESQSKAGADVGARALGALTSVMLPKKGLVYA